MERLTKDQAAIIGAFTGIVCGPFGDVHEAIEKKLGRPVWTHELADKQVWEEIKAAFHDDFIALCYAPSTT